MRWLSQKKCKKRVSDEDLSSLRKIATVFRIPNGVPHVPVWEPLTENQMLKLLALVLAMLDISIYHYWTLNIAYF